MRYYHYYLGSDKFSVETFRARITGHLSANDNEIVLSQNLNIRAASPQEAYAITCVVRDKRFNRLYTNTVIHDMQNNCIVSETAAPGEPGLAELWEPGVIPYDVTVIREAGANPLTGAWSDEAKDYLTIHAKHQQEAHRLADFISALSFNGQVRRTIINGTEHFDERY